MADIDPKGTTETTFIIGKGNNGTSASPVIAFERGKSAPGDAVIKWDEANTQFSLFVNHATEGVAALNVGNVAAVGVTATTVQATTLTATNLTSTSNVMASVASPVAAGSGQIDAAALTKDKNFVTGADGTTGVILPTAVAGMTISVKNNAASALKVYPATGAAINAIAANGAISMAAGTAADFMAETATQWFTNPLVPS